MEKQQNATELKVPPLLTRRTKATAKLRWHSAGSLTLASGRVEGRLAPSVIVNWRMQPPTPPAKEIPMPPLANEQCEEINARSTLATPEELTEMKAQLPDWQIINDGMDKARTRLPVPYLRSGARVHQRGGRRSRGAEPSPKDRHRVGQGNGYLVDALSGRTAPQRFHHGRAYHWCSRRIR